MTILKQSDVQWSKNLFDSLNDDGVWVVPRSGLIFQKRGGKMFLFDSAVRIPGIPDDELSDYQDADYSIIKEHFEAAGIGVEKD